MLFRFENPQVGNSILPQIIINIKKSASEDALFAVGVSEGFQVFTSCALHNVQSVRMIFER